MKATSALLLILALLGQGCTSSERADEAPTVEERPGFARHFRDTGVTGTFVLYDPGAERTLVHAPERARQRFIPASTYKILHALIALETGVVADTTATFAWDGVEREISAWNRDHTLATAFEYSVVWYYQRLARRIGKERMQDYVRRVGYGNADIGGGIDQFWLSGALRISPMEQVAFLKRLHEHRLPFSTRTMEAVEGIMVEDRGPGFVLHAKTGWADWEPVDVGWYVGYVVTRGRSYYFALNIDIERPEQGAARRRIARAILNDLGLLDTAERGETS